MNTNLITEAGNLVQSLTNLYTQTETRMQDGETVANEYKGIQLWELQYYLSTSIERATERLTRRIAKSIIGDN